jgi:hypothetical protein
VEFQQEPSLQANLELQILQLLIQPNTIVIFNYLTHLWRLKLKIFLLLSKDYQPGWTLVGAGIEKPEVMCKLEKDQIPKDVDFFNTKASAFYPDQNIVELADGKKVNKIIYYSILNWLDILNNINNILLDQIRLSRDGYRYRNKLQWR